VTPELAEFIAEQDSLYLGTAGVDGQPYIQYRGGPKSFLKVLDEHTLAFADFQGNAQYKARPERVLCFTVKAWSPNCPQHIKQRFTVDEMAPKIEKLQQCIADLEEANASLRKQLGEAARELAARDPSAPLIASLLTETPPGEEGCGID
jgi:uncharacterized protein